MAQKLSKKGKAAKAARDKKYAMTPNRRKKKAENQRKRKNPIQLRKQKESQIYSNCR